MINRCDSLDLDLGGTIGGVFESYLVYEELRQRGRESVFFRKVVMVHCMHSVFAQGNSYTCYPKTMTESVEISSAAFLSAKQVFGFPWRPCKNIERGF